MIRSFRAPLILAVFTLPAAAQVGHTWGPEQAPIGCTVNYSLQNGGSTDVTYDPCGFGVYDAGGALIYAPPCAGTVVVMPGQAHVSTWPQIDFSGMQVPAGVYHLNDPTGPAINVGGAQAAIAPRGTRGFDLCAPQDGGFPYLMGAMFSSGTPGFTVCGQAIPLPMSAFFLTLNDTALFQNFVGFLDANGHATANLSLPPSFDQMAQVDYAFVVFDFTQPCPVRRVSARTRTLLF